MDYNRPSDRPGLSRMAMDEMARLLRETEDMSLRAQLSAEHEQIPTGSAKPYRFVPLNQKRERNKERPEPAQVRTGDRNPTGGAGKEYKGDDE